MAHKIWSGSINFGLVTIPVGLYGATEDHTIHFNQYERGTSDRVRYRRYNERTGKELDYDDIVKGREVNGTLVTVDPGELEAIAPGRSRTLDITSFVDLSEIDPVYFQKTYWLAPTSHQHDRPYHLLRRALDETNRVGIATFVLRGKEYLTAIRADRDVLALDTLFFADEIRDSSDVLAEHTDRPPRSGRELRMATDLIHSMASPWRPSEYHDTYVARVEKLLEDKSQGRAPEPEEEPPEPTDIVDLGEALRRSADQARSAKSPGRGGGQDRTEQDKAGQDKTGRNKATTEASSGGQRRVARQRAHGRGSGGPGDVSTMTKSELGKWARELGIKGRSKLSREALEKAVDESSGAGSGRSRRSRKTAS